MCSGKGSQRMPERGRQKGPKFGVNTCRTLWKCQMKVNKKLPRDWGRLGTSCSGTG